MFAQRLGEEQRRQLVRVVRQMVTADRRVRIEEVSALEDLIRQIGGSGGAGAVDLSVFDSRKSKLIAAFEVLVVAHVDREFHESEAALFDAIVAEFGLSRQDVDAVDALARRGADLTNEINALIAETA